MGTHLVMAMAKAMVIEMARMMPRVMARVSALRRTKGGLEQKHECTQGKTKNSKWGTPISEFCWRNMWTRGHDIGVIDSLGSAAVGRPHPCCVPLQSSSHSRSSKTTAAAIAPGLGHTGVQD